MPMSFRRQVLLGKPPGTLSVTELNIVKRLLVITLLIAASPVF